MKRILAYRFSSFGDVLLTIPVIISFLNKHKDIELVFFTRAKFISYFPKHNQLTVVGLDLDNNFAGIGGLIRLVSAIKNKLGDSKVVLDFHQVLRTKIINIFLRLSGVHVTRLQKPRRQRKRYINGKDRTALPGVLELYKDVFERAGYMFPMLNPPFIDLPLPISEREEKIKRIGIAPFSKHQSKTWPFENMIELIQILKKEIDAQFYLLGSDIEISGLSENDKDNFILSSANTNTVNEIELIRNLDLMISMDSANMHLADILGVTVISIWGGTHPDLGFKPSFQKESNMILCPEYLSCQPCSVYGKESCKLKETPFTCLLAITPEMVSRKVLQEL